MEYRESASQLDPADVREKDLKVIPTVTRKIRYKIKKQMETPWGIGEHNRRQGTCSDFKKDDVADGAGTLDEIINLSSYVTPQAEKQ